MSDLSPADERPTPQATAAYIADLTGDLARLARRHGLPTLGYILDMARVEAEAQSGAGRPQERANGVPPR
ncbi:hypothetical protein CCR97_26605 [Rhodoplanes elegans]|uniref:Uncharacterized protein n=1 Tax=Rhodoplanes elegans TaxID=29408 RepID=A0A327KJA9_9BRAD|nr:hypothetical protein [Rhodoplanes elegans]MBK5961750.1 hypothetical protein [Rhodoplanes elegans]RAI38577.1 hypothetical protein CH338_12250 [Rhodoplanes elegans]